MDKKTDKGREVKMNLVKFDTHCHTAECSPDAHVNICDYIEILKSKGFGGMLVTDHDSYDGYFAYENSENKDRDFVVLRGIEYDTSDFGHMLVVMPQNLVPEVLRMRGLALKRLVKIVHQYGGILGPAHPCGERFLSFFTTGILKKVQKDFFMKKFDFVEGYNACETEENNRDATELARDYKKVMTAGSDAHKKDCVGMAYTQLPDTIKTEDDLIGYIRQASVIPFGGKRYGETTKDKLGIWNKGLVYGFFLYNKMGALLRFPARRRAFGQIAYEMEGFKQQSV